MQRIPNISNSLVNQLVAKFIRFSNRFPFQNCHLKKKLNKKPQTARPEARLRLSCSERRGAARSGAGGAVRGAERSAAERRARCPPGPAAASPAAAGPSAWLRAAGARLELTPAPGVCMQSLHSADPGGCAPLPSDGRSPSRPQGESAATTAATAAAAAPPSRGAANPGKTRAFGSGNENGVPFGLSFYFLF